MRKTKAFAYLCFLFLPTAPLFGRTVTPEEDAQLMDEFIKKIKQRRDKKQPSAPIETINSVEKKESTSTNLGQKLFESVTNAVTFPLKITNDAAQELLPEKRLSQNQQQELQKTESFYRDLKRELQKQLGEEAKANAAINNLTKVVSLFEEINNHLPLKIQALNKEKYNFAKQAQTINQTTSRAFKKIAIGLGGLGTSITGLLSYHILHTNYLAPARRATLERQLTALKKTLRENAQKQKKLDDQLTAATQQTPIDNVTIAVLQEQQQNLQSEAAHYKEQISLITSQRAMNRAEHKTLIDLSLQGLFGIISSGTFIYAAQKKLLKKIELTPEQMEQKNRLDQKQYELEEQIQALQKTLKKKQQYLIATYGNINTNAIEKLNQLEDLKNNISQYKIKNNAVSKQLVETFPQIFS